jgi:hypothetical protein
MTLEVFQDLNRHILRYSPGVRNFMLALVLVGGVLLLTSGVRVYNGLWNAKTFWIAIGGLWLASFPWWRRRITRRVFLQSPDRDQLIEWTISPERLTVATRSSRLEADWTTVTRVVRSDAGFLLYFGPIARWIPVTAFGAAGDQDQLAQWATQRCPAFEDRRT